MKNFSIRIINKNEQIIDGIKGVWGEIRINNFRETFVMQTRWWSIPTYEKQWLEGLKRIKTHSRSCLITTVQDLPNAHLINMWPLYKDGNKVFIQNYLLFGKRLENMINKKQIPFTPDTCYQFIPRRRTISERTPLSQWVTELNNN